DRCALAWTGERMARRAWPGSVTLFPVQFVIVEPGQASPPAVDAVDETIATPPLMLAERETMLRRLMPGVDTWPEKTVVALAARHRLSIGEIAALAGQRPSGPEDAAARVRNTHRHRLGDIAQWIECPFTANDLVLPATLLEAINDLVFEAGARAQVW